MDSSFTYFQVKETLNYNTKNKDLKLRSSKFDLLIIAMILGADMTLRSYKDEILLRDTHCHHNATFYSAGRPLVLNRQMLVET